ncbi:hypothetical protein FIBSPDRAFT_531557 [Athelia psychrophila]|uniref:Uncharacterized protein n=1 Tax=Athelia psychrophila TaxID=1759441 RepID=A0A166JHX9_9AGAM|nr:hypothetical protein FIBSPDRAFT_1056190 [Fibularhizoctonia sp. CBS 109695]KZP20878.1 hypothetical protein FIBSPDRAFT_531557 [Fibularhizoctonia sp. CBS 109695]
METERIVLLDFQKPPPQKRNILMATPRCLLKLMGQSFTTTVDLATYWRRVETRTAGIRWDFLFFSFCPRTSSLPRLSGTPAPGVLRRRHSIKMIADNPSPHSTLDTILHILRDIPSLALISN